MKVTIELSEAERIEVLGLISKNLAAQPAESGNVHDEHTEHIHVEDYADETQSPDVMNGLRKFGEPESQAEVYMPIPDRTPHIGNSRAPGEQYGSRKLGEPGPGRKRRSKKEMEEDNARLARSIPVLKMAEPTLEDVRSSLAERAARGGEAIIAKSESAPIVVDTSGPTLENLRSAVARYTAKVGAATTIANIRTIIGGPIIDVPPEGIADAIARVEAAINGAPLPKTPDPDPEPEEEKEKEIAVVTATKEAVIGSLMAYGKRFDGTSDTNAMLITKIDMPKLFTQAFGAGVTGLGSMPQSSEDFGKISMLIDDAVKRNPFNREVKA
jgi:hypothetical protein